MLFLLFFLLYYFRSIFPPLYSLPEFFPPVFFLFFLAIAASYTIKIGREGGEGGGQDETRTADFARDGANFDDKYPSTNLTRQSQRSTAYYIMIALPGKAGRDDLWGHPV